MKKRKRASSRIDRGKKKLFIFLLIVLIIALVLVVALIYVQSEKIREKGLLYSIVDFFSFKWLYSEQLGVSAYVNPEPSKPPTPSSGCDKVSCETYELGDGPKGPNGETINCGSKLSDGCKGTIDCPCPENCKSDCKGQTCGSVTDSCGKTVSCGSCDTKSGEECLSTKQGSFCYSCTKTCNTPENPTPTPTPTPNTPQPSWWRQALNNFFSRFG